MSARTPAHHLRYDPQSRCRPLAEWPAADQGAWAAALRPGELFDDPGRLAHLRPASVRMTQQAYGRWLTWLDWPVTEPASATRPATPETVAAFTKHLLERNGSLTVVQRLQHLRTAFKALAPGGDWGFVASLEGRVRAGADAVRDKRSQLRMSDELYDLGCDLMTTADTAGDPVRVAGRFRDGLMIALLAARPLRMHNLAMIEIGQHLVQSGEEWWLWLEKDETKTHRIIDLPLPEDLVDALEHYLVVHRPLLVAQGKPPSVTDRLWISRRGVPMKENAIGVRINAETKKAFGRSISPHMFRDAAATSIAIDDPEHIGMAAAVLGHAALATTERYYNLAGSVEAARGLQAMVQRLRLDE